VPVSASASAGASANVASLFSDDSANTQVGRVKYTQPMLSLRSNTDMGISELLWCHWHRIVCEILKLLSLMGDIKAEHAGLELLYPDATSMALNCSVRV